MISYSQSITLAIALILALGAWAAIAFIWFRVRLEREEYKKMVKMTQMNTDPKYHLVAVAKYHDQYGEYIVYLEEGYKMVDGRRVNLRKNNVISGDEGRAKQHEAHALYIGPWTKFGMDVSDIPHDYLFLAHKMFIPKGTDVSYPEAERIIAALERVQEIGARDNPLDP